MGTLNRQNTLSKQTSAVFNMTLDELQLSMGSGKAFGSMNMDEFLQTVWNQDPQLLNSVSATEPELGRQLFSQTSLEKLPQDYSGKTVDEVWNAIKSNQAQTSYEQPFTVGHLLSGLSAVTDNPRDPILAAQLQYLPQQYAHSQPEAHQAHMQQARLPDPPQLQIHPQSGLAAPSFAPVHFPSQHSQNGQPIKLQQSSNLQAPAQQYMQPQQAQHQQQFQFQPLPVNSHQQLSPTTNHMPVIQAAPVGRPNHSPPKIRPVSKGSPSKSMPADNVAVNIRASSQYPPAQQAGPSAHYGDSHTGSGPIPTAAPMPPSPNMDTNTRQQDRGNPVVPPTSPSAGPSAAATDEEQGGIKRARQRKRKEPEVVDERTARMQKRMVKNRESAARSRQRKQEYTADLEDQVNQLKDQNRELLQRVIDACAPPQDRHTGVIDGQPLRRTRSGL